MRIFPIVALILAMPGSAWAFEDGSTGFSGQGATTCALCHNGGGFTPAASLDGPVQVAPSSVNNPYTFEITALLASVGGLDVSADAGALSTSDAGTRAADGEVTHTAPRVFTGDIVSFSLDWTAPATEGTYTLYGCGVAGNGDGEDNGDDTTCTPLSVVVCANADADALCDSVDNCPDDANNDQVDTDSDTLGDACDACPADPANDADADGVCADADNCPADANADQADTDGDGAGDVCDTSCGDTDMDGVCDDIDVCPEVADPTQADDDGDGAGDACDPCPADPLDDTDADGVCGDIDNCPDDANNDQADTDTDGMGDVCDTPMDTGDTDDTDTDDTDTDDDMDDCGCSASPTGLSLVLLPALLGLALGRRRAQTTR